MNWNRTATCLLTVGLVFGSAGTPAAPGSGLANTPHDFTTHANGTVAGGPGSVGLCKFCHIPHSATTTQLAWNHTLSKNVFDYGVAETTAGTPYARFSGESYKGPSAKCLSCHDGSVAIGDVGNVGQGGRVLSADKIGTNGFAVTRQVGANGNMAGVHPVAMPYPFGRTMNTYNGITSGAQLVATEWVADPTASNIRLYSDDGSGNIVGNARIGASGIECSSCHDPHNKASRDVLFLRGRMSGTTRESGYLCAQCHDKY